MNFNNIIARPQQAEYSDLTDFGIDSTSGADVTGQSRDATRRLVYPSLTAAELDGQELSLDYIIPGVLARGQHAIAGGPHKSLKTLIFGCDLAVSAAIGGRFLGYFQVPRAVRTAVMSGECGYPVMQDNLRRVARAAGKELRYVGNLLVSDALPRFGHLDHVDAMGKFISDNGLELVIIDPAYLCFDGADAGNSFVMGGLLRSIADVFIEHKATMILLHHSTKSAGMDCQPLQLADLSFAGFREFAAQWLLLNRRTLFVPGTGYHELWLNVGGRAGHSGVWGINVDEGTFQVGLERTWTPEVLSYAEARAARREAEGEEKMRAKEEKARNRIAEDKNRIIATMRNYPGGESKTFIRDNSGLHSSRFAPALGELIAEGRVRRCEILKGNRKTAIEGYQLV